jgi:hypothetical protein
MSLGCLIPSSEAIVPEAELPISNFIEKESEAYAGPNSSLVLLGKFAKGPRLIDITVGTIQVSVTSQCPVKRQVGVLTICVTQPMVAKLSQAYFPFLKITISTYPQSLGVQRDNYYVALRMVMGTY